MPASVSKRAFIQWLPEKPSEPTSTLVLTSSAGHFVDVRLLPFEAKDGRITADKIDWAFAGTNASGKASEEAAAKLRAVDIKPYMPFAHEPKDDSTVYPVTHSTWKHSVSSRTADVRDIADEGDMLFVSKLGLTLEQGNMAHPETGKPTDYMEGWIDDEIERPRCVVLKLEDPSRQATGLAIRLDRHIEGVVRVGDAFSLQRWELDSSDQWQLTAVYGTAQLPMEALKHATLYPGDKSHTQYDDQNWTWEVIENVDVAS